MLQERKDVKSSFFKIGRHPTFWRPYISGDFNERYAKGVLDPIRLNAPAFSDGEPTDLIIIADLIGVERLTCDTLRSEISAATGIDRDHIMLTALHQHTSYAFLDANTKRAAKK